MNYYCRLFDEESGATTSNCVRFGGGGDGTGGGVERVAGWRSVNQLSRCGDIANPGFDKGNNIGSVQFCKIGDVGGVNWIEQGSNVEGTKGEGIYGWGQGLDEYYRKEWAQQKPQGSSAKIEGKKRL